MTVTITWSTTQNGSAQTSLDEGSLSAGSNTTAQTVFLRHNAVNPITSCGFFFTQKSGVYSGSVAAPDDFTELISWGDDSTVNGFGGIQVNMDAINSFTGGATWGMSSSQKTSVDNLKFTARTGVADKSINAVTLSKNMSSGMSVDGTIPAGVTDVRFQIRVKVPVSEGTLGTRQFDQVLKFSFTS